MKIAFELLIVILFVAHHHALFRENDDGKIKFYDQLIIKDNIPEKRRIDVPPFTKHSELNREIKHDKNDGLNIDALKRRDEVEKHVNDRKSISHQNFNKHLKHARTRNHIHKPRSYKNSNFTSNKRFKKEEVFVIDQGDLEDSDEDGGMTSDDDYTSMEEGDSDDIEDVTGDRKGTINRAEDIVLDEDSSLGNNNEVLSQSHALPDPPSDDLIGDALKDGSNTQFLENNQMIRSNEIKGNYIPVDEQQTLTRTKPVGSAFNAHLNVIESPQLEPEQLQVAKTLQTASRNNQFNFYKDISSPRESDPAVRKLISSDFGIDNSISRAISEQMQQDNEMTKSAASENLKNIKAAFGEDPVNVTTTGDFANIVEQATKGSESNQNVIKPNSIFSPVYSGDKPNFKLLEALAEKLHSPTSDFERINQDILKQNEPDVTRLDVNPGMSSLSPSEQQLISSLDEAVRSKDAATEIATKILMPMKEDMASDRAVSPNEQLLDMLAKGKFNKPLSDDILTRLSTFDINKQYMQDEGLSITPMLTKNFAKVGQKYLPVHSVAINYSKQSPKPIMDQQQFQRVEQLLKTDPTFLAQNHNFLNAQNYHTLNDLATIGEAVIPSHVVDYKQPIVSQNARVHQQRPRIQHTLQLQRPSVQNTPHLQRPLYHPKILNDLPEHIAKILEDFRAKQKPPKNFEDALSDAPNRNTADNFVPEKIIMLADEHNGSPQCKWNPCLNGGLCTAHPDKYHCSCKPGWIGDNCEKRSNCYPHPCNHGTCWPNVDGFTCTCKLGYKGAKCDMLDRCRPNPCKNNGACSETFEGVQCECAIGFKGRLCEMESKCEPINPCLNGATCHEYFDHYYCACASRFRGQNCEAFIAPTKPPPTIPIKHEGPQAIPPPDNISTGDLHEIFTEKYTDSSGKIVTSSSETYGPSFDTSSNPGASMVPHHPVPIQSPISEYSSSLSETSHGHFGETTTGRVGTPTANYDDKFIIHSADEKETKSNSKGNRKLNASDITGHDDRYQTHLVQVGIDSGEHHASVHVGNSIPDRSASITPVGNPHPTNNVDVERVQQINIDNKFHAKDVNEGQLRHLSEETVQEVYVDPMHGKGALHEGHLYNAVETTDDTQSVVVNSIANTRSSFPKMSAAEKSGKKPLKSTKTTKSSKQTNSTNLFNKTRSHLPLQKSPTVKQSIHKLQEKIESAGHQEIFHVNKVTKSENEKANNIIQRINTQIQQLTVNPLNPSFSEQKDAYSTWRRKALINFHKRNPNQPLPKNTQSLSKNSLCPKFCRIFCDPWCVKIGCCNTTKDEQEMFQNIEKQHSKAKDEKQNSNIMIIEADPCDKCNENADCVNRMCQCKTGFHGDGVICTIDNCLLCHLDAECRSERCVCKNGFFGDGYECRNNIYQKALCSKCHKKADCIGGDCLCARGYYGNGRSCWPLPIPV